MNAARAGLCLSPCGEFLSLAAVERHGARAIGQAFLAHQLRHSILSRLQVEVSAGEQFLQRHSGLRRVRMKRKVPELDFDVVLPVQPLNTNRTEIAPGSDVVREDFEQHRFAGHRFSRPWTINHASREHCESGRKSQLPGVTDQSRTARCFCHAAKTTCLKLHCSTSADREHWPSQACDGSDPEAPLNG